MSDTLEYLCRACLSEACQDSMVSLDVDDVKSLFELSSLLLDQDDPLPRQICGFCYNKFCEWSFFRSVVLESDRQLRSSLKDIIPVLNEVDEVDFLYIESEDNSEGDEEDDNVNVIECNNLSMKIGSEIGTVVNVVTDSEIKEDQPVINPPELDTANQCPEVASSTSNEDLIVDKKTDEGKNIVNSIKTDIVSTSKTKLINQMTNKSTSNGLKKTVTNQIVTSPQNNSICNCCNKEQVTDHFQSFYNESCNVFYQYQFMVNLLQNLNNESTKRPRSANWF